MRPIFGRDDSFFLFLLIALVGVGYGNWQLHAQAEVHEAERRQRCETIMKPRVTSLDALLRAIEHDGHWAVATHRDFAAYLAESTNALKTGCVK